MKQYVRLNVSRRDGAVADLLLEDLERFAGQFWMDTGNHAHGLTGDLKTVGKTPRVLERHAADRAHDFSRAESMHQPRWYLKPKIKTAPTDAEMRSRH